MWSFPEKEDKAARFKRWAEVLRFKPREARPPISSDGARLDVKVALEVFYREAQAAGIAPPGLPDSPRHQALRISEEEVAEMLREKVKERILQFLIECGPAKGLCVISEEDRSVAGTPAASVPSTPRAYGGSSSSAAVPSTPSRQHAVDMRKLMETYASDSSAPSTPRAAPGTRRGQASPRAPPALALDGEPVLRTETGETVTRELLWAVLARIHAEAQAQAQADAQAAAAAAALGSSDAPAPSAPALPASAALSASVIAGRSADSLKQPLLGEWKNPLQQSVE